MDLKLRYNLRYKLGCIGKNQYKYRKYVPQSVAQTKLCATSATNVTQNVAQFRVHGGNSIQLQKICTTKCGTNKTLCHMYHKCGTKCGTNQGASGKINIKNLTAKLQDENLKKKLCLKNRGPGSKNQKSTLNKSKVEYYKAFWMKIQKLKFFR